MALQLNTINGYLSSSHPSISQLSWRQKLLSSNPLQIFPLKKFQHIPFNIPHSTEAARIWNLLGGHDNGDNRSVVRDDVKIMAQALHEGISFILTEDASTLYKYCERLRVLHKLNIRAIKLADGFDSSALRLDGQKGIESFI